MEIVIHNVSTVVSDDDILNSLSAFQVQIDRDFGPAWGVQGHLSFQPKSSKLTSSQALVVVCDDADQAGALGYHDVTSKDAPVGKVFAKTTRDYGGLWTVTMSHEILELLGDPAINRLALHDAIGRAYSFEACDAVEDDQFAYEIHHDSPHNLMIKVSDFVLPRWFDEHAKGGAFSHCKHVHAPFQLAAGGYIGYLDLKTGHWKQQDAMHLVSGDEKVCGRKRHDLIPRPGSRRERRARGRSNWQRSTAA